jgi:type II secretory pathway pseudopilin PulG
MARPRRVRPARARARDRGQAGLTLVELMVSMTLVSAMVAMVFALFLQMSLSYRTAAQIGELQQTLVAAQNMVLSDVRQAGARVSSGFRLAADAVNHWPLEIVNDSDGPDTVRVGYASSSGASVVSFDGTTLVLSDEDTIAADDLIVLSDPQPAADVDPAPPVVYDACVLKVEAVIGTSITVSTDPPWGAPGNGHCAAVTAALAAPPADTMAYRFALVGYRIDPDRKELGVLQRSSTGGVEDDWEDLGIGFTDLQVATRWFEDDDVTSDDDDDGDPELDWYAGDDQTTRTAAGSATTGVPIELSVSFVVRTSRRVNGVLSAATPNLTDPANEEHNPVGDRASVQLEGVADADRPDELRGEHVYRWSTTQVDLRNLQVSM